MRKFIFINLLFLVLSVPLTTAAQDKQAVLKLNFCDWLDESKNYAGQLAESRAVLWLSTVSRVDGADASFYSPECNNEDFFSPADFSKLKNADRWAKFFRALPAEKNYRFEIKFTGRLSASYLPAFGHLSWSRTEIEVGEILSVKDVSTNSKISPPDSEAPAPLNQRAGQLRNDTYFFLRTFFQAEFERERLNSILADDFVFTDWEGKIIARTEYLELRHPPLAANQEIEQTAYKLNGAKKEKDELIVTSLIEIKYRGGKVREIKCESVCRLENGFWKIKRASVSENFSYHGNYTREKNIDIK
jgi:hypothetical protein